MIKNILLAVLFIGLLVSLFPTFTLSKTVTDAKNRNIELQAELNNCEYINKRNDERSAMCILSENKNLPNLSLVNFNLDTIQISDIVGETKLIYRFYEGTCVECIETELDIVKQLGDSIGVDNIIVISDFKNINRLKAIINRKQIHSQCFIYSDRFDLPIELDDIEVASFFLLEKDLLTRSVFKAGGDQSIEDPYYKSLMDFFKDRRNN